MNKLVYSGTLSLGAATRHVARSGQERASRPIFNDAHYRAVDGDSTCVIEKPRVLSFVLAMLCSSLHYLTPDAS